MTMYYTLVPARLAHVDRPAPDPEDGELPAFTSPRSITVFDLVAELWGERDEIEYLLTGRMALVQVSPVRTVESARIDGSGPEVIASNGWTVEAILSLDELLGPQSGAIREVVSSPLGVNDESSYDDELTRMQKYPEMDEVHADMASPDELVARAVAALDAAGFDGSWWESQVGCVGGYELIALAARDLVDTTDGWCVHGFQQLMRPRASTSKGWPTLQPAHS